jgi:hypothetical protein
MSFRSMALGGFLVLGTSAALALGTSFTYQGRLTVSGSPVTGTYDLEFRLYTAEIGGTQVGSAVVSEDVAVTGGLFTVALDFGGAAFDGTERWLALGVRPGSDNGAFEALSPRQHLTPAPYALHASSADAASALSCTTCVAEGQLAFDTATQAELAAHQGSADHDARYARLVADNVLTGNQSVSGSVSATGTVAAAGVNVGAVSRPCTAADEGTLRYAAAAKQVEYCDGAAWKPIVPPGNFGQVSWTGPALVAAGAWAAIPGSLLNITTGGGPLLITAGTYLANGQHSGCRPVIDGVWAGSYGLPDPGDPFWQEGLAYSAGGEWHPWHKTRLYPGVPAGNHTLQLQCVTDGGSLIVGASNIGSSLHFVELRP